MKQVTLKLATERLGDLVDAAVKGEDVVVVRDDNAAVRLVPITAATNGKRTFGSAKELLTMSEDFDAPVKDFREYEE